MRIVDRISFRLLAPLLLWAFAAVAAAQTAPAPGGDIDATLDRIRQQLDSTQRAIGRAEPPTDAELRKLRSAALAAQQEASDIADLLTPQLASVDARVAELGTPAPGTKEDADVAAQRALIAKSRGTLDGQVKLARLLGVESQQLAAQLGTLRRAQFQAQLGTRTHSILAGPFWTDWRAELPNDLARVRAVGEGLVAPARATPTAVWIALPVVVVALVWLLGWGRRALVRWLTAHTPPGRLRRSLYAALVVAQWTLALGLAGTAVFAAFDWNGTLTESQATDLGVLIALLWVAGFMYGLATALICARRPSWRLLPIPDAVATSLRHFPALVTFVSVSTWSAERIAVMANTSLSTTVALNCIVALTVGLTVVMSLMHGERVWRRELAQEGARARPVWLSLLAGLNWLVLATAVACLLAGYVAFGSFAVGRSCGSASCSAPPTCSRR